MNNQQLKHSAILELKQVNFTTSLGANELLQNISFAVNQGDRLAMIGPSGAGKTSLLRLLNRLSEPTTGIINLEGQDFRTIPVKTLRSNVVLVSQESKLLGMKVTDALAYPLVLQNLSPAEIQQRLKTWINKLHISEDWLDRNELQLSVGQRQLVAIARALVMQPKIILLDEPTSALDAGRANYVLEIFQQLTDSGQTTILMVNHQLDLAQKFASRVLYLEKGELLQDSSAQNINWQKLRENLVKAEAKNAEEWL